MSEGKLKKRIKQDSFFVPRSESSTFSGHVIKWQTGWRLIDEAKKDFPSIIGIKGAIEVLNAFPSRWASKDLIRNTLKTMLNAQEKWLGDDE